MNSIIFKVCSVGIVSSLISSKEFVIRFCYECKTKAPISMSRPKTTQHFSMAEYLYIIILMLKNRLDLHIVLSKAELPDHTCIKGSRTPHKLKSRFPISHHLEKKNELLIKERKIFRRRVLGRLTLFILQHEVGYRFFVSRV